MKAGRITGALMIMYTGVALLLDFIQGTSLLLILVRWWPVAIVLLGLEYLIVTVVSVVRKRQMGFDWGSVVFAVIVTGAVTGVFHGQALLDEQELSIGDIVFSDDSGETFDLPTQVVPLDYAMEKLAVTNRNGDIVVVSSDVKEITVDAAILIPRFSQEEAESVAEAVNIIVQQDDVLAIEVETETYKSPGFFLRPKVNLRLTVPASLDSDLEAVTTNGRIVIHDVSMSGQLSMKSTNGALTARTIIGNVHAEVTNGTVELMDIEGAAQAATTNGQVKIEHVTGAVEASSTNGRVEVRSHTIGGDWHVSTTVGALSIYVPEEGDFTLQGKVGALGSIVNELGIEQEQRELNGRFGTGHYQVQLETSVGALAIHKQPKRESPDLPHIENDESN